MALTAIPISNKRIISTLQWRQWLVPSLWYRVWMRGMTRYNGNIIIIRLSTHYRYIYIYIYICHPGDSCDRANVIIPFVLHVCIIKCNKAKQVSLVAKAGNLEIRTTVEFYPDVVVREYARVAPVLLYRHIVWRRVRQRRYIKEPCTAMSLTTRYWSRLKSLILSSDDNIDLIQDMRHTPLWVAKRSTTGISDLRSRNQYAP